MMRYSSPLCFAALALLVSACTQTPAPVANRGGESFAKGFASLAPASGYRAKPSYNAPITVAVPSHVDTSTKSAVRIDAVSATELPPPEPAKPAAVPADKRSEVQLKPLDKETLTPPVVEAKVEKPKTISKFIWPVQGKVISKFGPKGKGKANDGIDIAAESGEPVAAAAAGEVVFVGDQLKGYGNMVLIKHAGNRHTTYAYLQRASVSRYDRVKQGDIIGYVGSSGSARQSQLYFAMREGTKPVNPEKYLSSNFASLN